MCEYMDKKHLTPFGERFLSFLAAGIFLNGGASIYKNTVEAEKEHTKSVVDSIGVFENNLDKSNVEQLEIIKPRNDQGKYVSYAFDPKQTLQKLEKAVPIFYKYNNKLKFFKSEEEKKEYDDAMRTIFDLNIEFVEIENRAIKEEIAPELNVSTDDIQILYELSSLNDDGYINIFVNNQNTHYTLSNELSNKITQYKKHILLTQGVDYDTLEISQKQDIVNQILDNISSSREYLINYLVENDIKLDDSKLEVVSADCDSSKSTSTEKDNKSVDIETER